MSEIEVPQESKKNNGAFIAIIVILLLMLAAMAYFLSNKDSELNASHNEVKRLEAEQKAMNSLLSEYIGDMSSDLKKDFKQMLHNYDELEKMDASKAEEIQAQKSRIEGLMKELDRNKGNAALISRLRRENEELRSIMRGYVYEIDSLNTLNLEMRSELDDKTIHLAKTTSAKDSLQVITSAQADKIKEGQTLTAYDFTSTGFRNAMGGNLKESSKAKNVVQIKSEFTIGKNDIATKEDKPVYMAIVTSDGKTLQTSSGNVINTENGPVAYSDVKKINYNGKSIKLAVYYSLRGQVLAKGDYKINIYCQGQLIGTDNLYLK